MEVIAILFVVTVGVWFLMSPFIVFSLWNRLNELEASVRQLKLLGKARSEPDRYLTTLTERGAAVGDETEPAESIEATGNLILPPVIPHHFKRSVDETPLSELLAAKPGRASDPQQVFTTSERHLPPVLPPASMLKADADDSELSQVASRDTQTAQATPAIRSRDESSTFEEILAGKWLTWVGALAVIIGAGFGFKYAVENGWLDPSRRVMLGMFVGACSFVGGAFAMRRDYRFLGQGLTGAAMGVLYMSCYAAHAWYGLVPYSVAFAGMALTTAIGLAFAARFESQPTAFLGLLGGFLTPAMLRGIVDPFWVLFPYLLLLDAGVLWVAGRRRWLGVQNLAFVATCLSWLVWLATYQQFDSVALHQSGPFWPTLGFLTAFFIEFAAMGVIFNIARQRKAEPGDFFLILVTPVAYFGAVYGLTHIVFQNWLGLFAIGMVVIYGYLTVLCSQLNPKGKSVAAAMAGLAGTFLIIAAPIQFTGHWVTIAWIAESVLLVEIGLRFREKTLTLTGLSLLAKVQFILLIYALGTFVDPVGFQTAFVRKQFHWVNGSAALVPSWTNIFNGRSFSYLVDVLGLAWLAWTCRRRAKSGQVDELLGVKGRSIELWLAAGVPLIGLMLAITETFVWGVLRDWHGLTILSGFTMWAALAGVVLIAWSVFIGPRPLEKLGWFLFVLMGGALLLNLGWSSVGILERGLDEVNWATRWWLLNPRGFAFLTVFGAGVMTALIYKIAKEEPLTLSPQGRGKGTGGERIPLDRLFGSGAYVLALTMVLLETFAWGQTGGWKDVLILSAFVAWTALFGAGLAVWKFVGKSVGLDGLLVSTFVVLVSFLAMNSVATLSRAESGALATTAIVATATASGDAVEWWLLNPRGVSFLLAIGAALLAARLERTLRLVQVGASTQPGPAITRGEQFGLLACLVGLTIVFLETTAWAVPRQWFTESLASSLALGTAPFALGLAVWAAWYRRRVINAAVGAVFTLLGLCLFVAGIAALDSQVAVNALRSGEPEVTLWLFHPRGAAFLVGIAVAGLSAALYLRASQGEPSEFASNLDGVMYSQALGVSAWLAGLAMFTVEALAQGAARHWQTEAGLAITLSWTAYALGTLVAGISGRSGTVRVLALSLFVLTVAKVFLFDVWHLDTVIRVFAFVSLGVTLLLVSFLYRRYRDRIRSWIAPAE